MKTKVYTLALCALILMSGTTESVSAQAMNTVCAPFNQNLGYGFRGNDVYRLQQVLISQGKLANGNATGYYGSQTILGVKRFQSTYGISTTGFVGPQTRSALYSVTCGGNQNPPNYNQAPTITSINPTVGTYGTVITIYGNNFSQNGDNTISIGNLRNFKTGIVSPDGRTLQFEIPGIYSNQSFQCPFGYTCQPAVISIGNNPITVTTSFGTSNSINFQMTGNSPGNPNNQTPTITSISPAYGPYGTTVTIYGTNFNTSSGNSINFANAQNVRTGVISPNGSSIQFTIPATPCSQGYSCAQVVLNPGYYGISINNGYTTSNSYNFQLTDSNPNPNPNPNNPNPNPTIDKIDGPMTLAVGQQGSWTIRASNSGGGNITYSVLWGDETNQGNVAAINDTYLQSTTFTHAYQNRGTYTARFTVRNTSGREVTSTITTVVSGNTTQNFPTLTSLSPAMGSFGNPITITGTNFSRYDNSVNFGNVARAGVHISSYDGKTLQFTPTGSTCSADAYVCTLQLLGDGMYPVSVTTPLGTSDALQFIVSSNTTTSDQNQTLGLNQSARVGSVTVTPRSIVEDSRCPMNVNCIQAGRVLVATTIQSMYGYTTINLSSTGNAFTTDEGYKIQIVDVLPAKSSTGTIQDSEYKIIYKIWR